MAISTKCERCSEIFDTRSFKARYCSDRCRKAASRARAKAAAAQQSSEAQPVTDQSVSAAPTYSVATSTLAELQKAKVDGTALGLGALVLAVRIDAFSPLDPPSALATLVKEHAAAMARAKGGIVVDSLDPFDELARRREERRQAAGA